jgi:hypothetical protein
VRQARADEALGTEPPVDDLGLVDHVTVALGCGQTGTDTDGALDIGGGSTGAADHMVMVITDACLVAGDRPLRLDAAQQTGPGEGGQHVVDGLVADLGQLVPNVIDDRVGVGVGMNVHGAEHRDPRAGDPKIMAAQKLLHCG